MFIERYLNNTHVKFKGGGGSSGAVSWPAYMHTVHNDWLDNTGTDTITSSITDIMNTALGNNPWTGQIAYNPDADIATMVASHTTLQDLITLLSTGTTLDTLVANVLSDTYIDNLVDEFAADLDARMLSEIIPRYERGMQDINAVSSSAFAIGRALIEENQDRQVAKFSAELHVKSSSDDALKIIQMKLEYQKLATSMLIELYRIKIVAKKEQNDLTMDIDERDAKWNLEIFQYGGNLLAAISGGSVGTQKPSTAQSAIGGALVGGAATAMMGIGILPGLALGAASAFL